MASVIDKMLANGVTVVLPQPDMQEAADSEAQKTICISGKLPSGKKKADYQEPLLAVGYELVDDVSKDLGYLVLADAASTSSKAVKARKLGVRVISEDELVSLLTTGR